MPDLALISDPRSWVALVTLTLLEIVLGIDNLVFISILVARLPRARQRAARITGLALATLTRLALLFSIVWLTHLVEPWFYVGGQAVSARDLILFLGGLFLIGKAVLEIHRELEHAGRADLRPAAHTTFAITVAQIAVIDIVFSLDSVFTAVGLAQELWVMAAAIIVAIVVMMWVSQGVGAFIERHPTIKMLALAFLILIGAALVAAGCHFDIPKGYLYFAMAFAVAVEMINVRLRQRLDARGKR